ncbi:LUD domain-containing protein [Rhodococcus sp. X156]|uniref:LutC/YkgG family protein n=1 Tax=Rhodococcus sp. X156 TaxID=2499145 RepID=UPI000FDC0C56|nr:LUD domain-containing protein [Rhodococcus sp. X156]
MTPREEVLARIRTALADRPVPPPVPRDYHHRGDQPPGSPEAVALLAARVDDYRAQVHRVDLAEQVPATLARLLAGHRAVVVPPDLPAEWAQVCPGVVRDTGLSPQQLDEVDAVVTGCAVAIAVTGTLVLDAGAAQGRRALTLVPDHHVCVVRAEQVVASVPEALARLDPTRPLTFISGPSATSDIELQRVEGVHGPRTLDVVIVG